VIRTEGVLTPCDSHPGGSPLPVTAVWYLTGESRKEGAQVSSAFMMLLLDELPEGWTLELADPDDWEDGDDVHPEEETSLGHEAQHPPAATA